MDRYMVNAYRMLRDHAKPVSEQDAADLVKVRTFTPPSKAHLKRLARHARAVKFVERARDYAPLGAVAAMQRDFVKEQKAKLGGTRTVASWTPPVWEKPKPALNQIEPIQKQELWPERPALGPSPREARRLEQRRLIALARMVFTADEPDFVAIMEAFGSFEAYWKAVDNAI
jgi:hypothetical protein